MKTGIAGELIPTRGFSRQKTTRPKTGGALDLFAKKVPHGQSVWRSHDDLVVVSSLEDAYLPGSGEPPLVGPQWLVSVSRRSGGIDARCRVTDDDVARVVEGFEMPAFDEDNHHPGIARHLWCPIEDRYRSACECKISERTIVDGVYRWTTEDQECRGCEYEWRFGLPCPLHAREVGRRPVEEIRRGR